MRVSLQLTGHLTEFFPLLKQVTAFAFDRPVTVADVLAEAKVPAELPSVIACNGQRVTLEHVPADGDHLLLISPLAGG
jgi:sulfur carrier protein ThiS